VSAQRPRIPLTELAPISYIQGGNTSALKLRFYLTYFRHIIMDNKQSTAGSNAAEEARLKEAMKQLKILHIKVNDIF
jgi:hypothetical protein